MMFVVSALHDPLQDVVYLEQLQVVAFWKHKTFIYVPSFFLYLVRPEPALEIRTS